MTTPLIVVVTETFERPKVGECRQTRHKKALGLLNATTQPGARQFDPAQFVGGSFAHFSSRDRCGLWKEQLPFPLTLRSSSADPSHASRQEIDADSFLTLLLFGRSLRECSSRDKTRKKNC